jgi:hypothetical protein
MSDGKRDKDRGMDFSGLFGSPALYSRTYSG